MEPNKTKIPRNVLIVAFVALFSGLGQDLITPVLPAFLVALGMSHSSMGLIDGLLQGMTSIFRFISGILSDRFKNRKAFVFLGYSLSSVARPLLFFASSLPFIGALRAMDGAGKGMKDAPRDALIADSAQQQTLGRAFGFQRLVDTAGSVLGPLLGTLILLALTPSLGTYRIIFAVSAIPGIIALALIWFGIKEPNQASPKPMIGRTPFSWKFWIFTFSTAIVMLTKINDTLFLVRAGDIGIKPTWIPMIFAGFTLVYALLSYPIGIWSDKYGKLPFIALGWLVLAGVEFGFAQNLHISVMLFLFAFYGLFYALTEGSSRAFIANLVTPESRGSAYAIFYTIVGLCVIIGGYVLGHVWDTLGTEIAFKISCAGSLLGFIVLASILFQDRKKA